jgi:NodT family efflux transporter outer membrane factor (OMF) lipoprotein
VGPDYSVPPQESPPAWGEPAETAPVDLTRWWTVFGDRTLDLLIARAVQANLDLRMAQSRIREARAQVGVAFASLLPEVDADGSATRLRMSKNGPFGAAGFPLYRNDFLATFDASWEIDLFGGNRRAVEAAGADLEATVQDRNAVLVSLLGDVARAYVELRGAQRQLAVLRGNEGSARGTVDLTKARLQAGVATALDLARAEALLASVSSQIPLTARAIRQSLYRLGVLLGKSPRSLEGELTPEGPIPAVPPRVAVGLPSDLLRRRPDVRRAERQLAAATARIGQATADYYPKLTLLGSFGAESLKASDWFTWPSRLWSVGPSVRLPLFQGGRVAANVEVQNAREEQARTLFEETFLLALEEVENALTAWFREGERHGSLEDEVAADRRAVDLADDLHRKGLVSFLDVLEAQRALYGAQLQLADSEMSRSVDLVALYKALGGGWDPAAKD